MVWNSFERKNYYMFSIYVVEFKGIKKKYLGVFKIFFEINSVLEKAAGDAIEKIKTTG